MALTFPNFPTSPSRTPAPPTSPAFTAAANQARGKALTSIVRTWQTRANQARALGIPSSAVLPVAQYDIERRLKGYRPLTSLEAALQTRVQATGQGVLEVPEEKRDSGVLGIITNIPEDVKELTTGLLPHHLLPALAKEAYSTVTNPDDTLEGLANLGMGMAAGGPLTDTGRDYLSKAASTPGVRFIPGVTTLSDPGRIFTHPVQSLLDIYPLGVGASKLASRAMVPGETLSAIRATGQAARQYRKVSPLEVPPELTLTGREAVVESMARGRPAQALYRQTFSDSFRQGVNSRIANAQASIGVAPFQRNMQHGADIMLRDINAKQREAYQRNIEPLMDLTPNQRNTLFEMATRPDMWDQERILKEQPTLVPHLESIRTLVDDELAPLVEQSGDIFTVEIRPGYKVYYSRKGRGNQVYNAQQRFNKAQEQVELARKNVDDITESTPEAAARHQAKLDRLQQQLSQAEARLNRKAETFGGYPDVDSIPGKALLGNRVLPQTPELINFGRQYGINTDRFLDAVVHDLRNRSLEVRREFVRLMEDQGYSKITRVKGGNQARPNEYTRTTLAEEVMPKRKPERTKLPTDKERAKIEARIETLRQQIADMEMERDFNAVDLDTYSPKAKRRASTLNKRIKQLEEATDNYNEVLRKVAPDSFLEMLRPELRQRVVEAGGRRAMDEGAGTPAELFSDFDAQTALEIFESTGDPSGLIPAHEWVKIKSDVQATWQQLLDEGHRPIWIHNLPSARVSKEFNPRPMGVENPNPAVLKSRTMDLTPRMTDVAASLHAAQVELIKKASHEAYIDEFIRLWGRSLDEETTPGSGITLHDEISKATDLEISRRKAKGQWHDTMNRQDVYDQILNKNYDDYSPDRLFGFGQARAAKYSASGKQLYLPKTLTATAEKLLQPQDLIRGPVGRGLTGATRAFKVAVLGLSPKHLMDVIFSDTIMMLMRGGKEEVKSIVDAYHMARRTGEGMPIELPRHIDLDDPATLFEIGKGKHWGRVVSEKASVLYKFEEFMNNWQRSMSYLGEYNRTLKRGGTEDAARLAGIDHARKALLDIEGMSPFERAILRQVFPFYGFMRYIFRYALTYPIDHPMRAAIIATASRIAREDNDSNLPSTFYNYMFFGSPSDTGDLTGIDLRATNPFRDFSNLLTFTGFMRSLHPLAGGVMQIAGMDPLAAAPELYPDLSYDPETGRVQFNRMSEGHAAYTLAKSVIPQLEIGDWLLQRSDNMKQLANSNPEAYNRALQRSLFLPLIPRKVNVGEVRRSAEMAKLESASRAVTDAFRDVKHVNERYNYLPLNGQLYTPQQINLLIDVAKEAGMNPRTLAGQL